MGHDGGRGGHRAVGLGLPRAPAVPSQGRIPVTDAGQAPVLVTGGSGFIGGALVDALVAAGRPVRALARSADSAQALQARGAQPVTGDVLDPGSLARAMDSCGDVYPAPEVNTSSHANTEPMERVNVG